MPCLQCGQLLNRPGRYCSAACVTLQLATLRQLLNTTPRLAFTLNEWEDFTASYNTDLELLTRTAVTA